MTRFDAAITTALLAVVAFAGGIGLAYALGHLDGVRAAEVDCSYRVEVCSTEVGVLSDLLDGVRRNEQIGNGE